MLALDGNVDVELGPRPHTCSYAALLDIFSLHDIQSVGPLPEATFAFRDATSHLFTHTEQRQQKSPNETPAVSRKTFKSQKEARCRKRAVSNPLLAECNLSVHAFDFGRASAHSPRVPLVLHCAWFSAAQRSLPLLTRSKRNYAVHQPAPTSVVAETRKSSDSS